MTLTYSFEPIEPDFPKKKLEDIEKQISKSIGFLGKHIDRLLEFLKKEEKMKNYIEISLTVLGTNISYKLNYFYGGLIISVMFYDDSKIFGHLLIQGYDCLDRRKIIELGKKWDDSSLSARFKKIT